MKIIKRCDALCNFFLLHTPKIVFDVFNTEKKLENLILILKFIHNVTFNLSIFNLSIFENPKDK